MNDKQVNELRDLVSLVVQGMISDDLDTTIKVIENTLNSLKPKPKLYHRYFAIMNYETGAIKFCEGDLPMEVDEEEWLIEHHAYSDSSMYYMSSDEPIKVEHE